MTTKSILWIKWKTNTVVDMASAAEVKEFSARCQQLTNHPVWPSVAVFGWSNALRTSMQQEKVCRYTQKSNVHIKNISGNVQRGHYFPCYNIYFIYIYSSFMYIKIPVHTFKNFLSFEIKYYSKLIYFLWGTG